MDKRSCLLLSSGVTIGFVVMCLLAMVTVIVLALSGISNPFLSIEFKPRGNSSAKTPAAPASSNLPTPTLVPTFTPTLTPSSTPTPTSTPTATSTPTSTETPRPTDTFTPTKVKLATKPSTPRPTDTPIPEPIGVLRQPLRLGNILVTVNYFIESEGGGKSGFYKASPNKKWIIVYFDLENVGMEDHTINPLHFLLKDSDGVIRDYAIGSGMENKLELLMLAPGGRVKGALPFEIPVTASAAEFIYQPDRFFDKTKLTIRLQ
jgi:hypothetical protein